MASVFADITLTWRERTYRIPARKVMGAINRIEDVITLKELTETGAERATVNLSRVACAFASVLRYAGAVVTEEEVYLAMLSEDGAAEAMQAGVSTLLEMMIPPAARAGRDGDADAGKSPPAASGS